MKSTTWGWVAAATLVMASASASAETLLGYVSGAETLPAGAVEGAFSLTQRADKGAGEYTARDLKAEIEYGFTPRFTGAFALKGMSLDTRGLVIDGYLPGANDFGFKATGVEGELKYKFLSAAIEPLGLSAKVSLAHSWVDPHSGQDKDTTSLELALQAQKFFLDDQLVALANTGIESTYARRDPLATLPPGFEWPTDPEMEIELKAGAGLSYRVAPRWFVGAEVLYETEFETEVGQERWSAFAGPSIHYAEQGWWATFTWFSQLSGGGETYAGQTDTDLHLIEKTEDEFRFQVGFDF